MAQIKISQDSMHSFNTMCVLWIAAALMACGGPEGQTPESFSSDGYIVSLSESPACKYYVQQKAILGIENHAAELESLLAQGGNQVAINALAVKLKSQQHSLRQKMIVHRQFLRAKQQALVEKIQAKKVVKLTEQWVDVVNAVVVSEIDTELHQYLSESADVVAIEPIRSMSLHGSQDSRALQDPQAISQAISDGFSGQGVTIAMIDSGIDYTHSDFGSCKSVGADCRIRAGIDIADNDDDPMDFNGHGTHVASIAAANGAMQGIAPEADLLAVKIVRDGDQSIRSSDVVKAIAWVLNFDKEGQLQPRADVINISAGYSNGAHPDDILSQAVDCAVDAGLIVVVSAGNDGPNSNTVDSPGTARKAITVGALVSGSQVASFSSRGPVVSQSGEKIIKPEVLAPGMGICAAAASLSDGLGGSFSCGHPLLVSRSGTSMAAPHVAGLAARLRAKYPEAAPADIKKLLMNP